MSYFGFLCSWGNYELQCYTSSANNIDVIPHTEYPADDGVSAQTPYRMYTSGSACIQDVFEAQKRWRVSACTWANIVRYGPSLLLLLPLLLLLTGAAHQASVLRHTPDLCQPQGPKLTASVDLG